MSDYVVKDIGLADFGRKELDIAETEMPDADGGFSWERNDLIDALKAAV